MSKTDGKQVDNSHIIPRVYLRNFLYLDTEFNNESVFIAKKDNLNEWRRRGIEKKPFAKHQFYDFSTISDKEQVVENFLGVIESDIGPVFENIKSKQTLSNDDIISLKRFVFSMRNRTILQQNNWQNFANKLHQWYSDFDISEDKRFTKEYFKNYEDFSKSYILMTDKLISDSKIQAKSFYILKNETDIPFLTSDNPVVLVSLYKKEIEFITGKTIISDLLINRKSILLPISEKHCVFYCDYINAEKEKIIQINDSEIIKYLNILQIYFADEYIISNQDNSSINYQEIISSFSMNEPYLLLHTDNDEHIIPCNLVKSSYSIEVTVKNEIVNQEIFNKTVQDVTLFSNESKHFMKNPKIQIIEDGKYLNIKFRNLPFDIER